MLFWDAPAGRAFPGVPLASARPPGGWRCAPAGAGAGRAERGARSRLRRAGRGWARSCRGSAGPGRAPAGAAGRADGARGGRPFGVHSTFLRAYVAGRREEGTTSSPLRRRVASSEPRL